MLWKVTFLRKVTEHQKRDQKHFSPKQVLPSVDQIYSIPSVFQVAGFVFKPPVPCSLAELKKETVIFNGQTLTMDE